MVADIGKGFGIVAVDLDPEHIQVRYGADHLQKTFGLGVEIEVQENIHIRPGAVAEGFVFGVDLTGDFFLHVQLGVKRPPEPSAPAFERPILGQQDA